MFVGKRKIPWLGAAEAVVGLWVVAVSVAVVLAGLGPGEDWTREGLQSIKRGTEIPPLSKKK